MGYRKQVLAFKTHTTSKNHLFVEFATPYEAHAARGRYAGGWQGDPVSSHTLMPIYDVLTNATQGTTLNPFYWDGQAPVLPKLLPSSVSSLSLPWRRARADEEYPSHSSYKHRHSLEAQEHARFSWPRESSEGRWLKIWEERDDRHSSSSRHERSYEHHRPGSSLYHHADGGYSGHKTYDSKSIRYGQRDDSRKRRRDDMDSREHSSSKKRSYPHPITPAHSSEISLGSESQLNTNLSGIQKRLWTDGDPMMVDLDGSPEEDDSTNSNREISHGKDIHPWEAHAIRQPQAQDALTQRDALNSMSRSPSERAHKILDTPPLSALLPKKPSTTVPTSNHKARIDDHHVPKSAGSTETANAQPARKPAAKTLKTNALARRHPKTDSGHVSPSSGVAKSAVANGSENNHATGEKRHKSKESEPLSTRQNNNPITRTQRVGSELYAEQIERLRQLYLASQAELMAERAAKRRAEDETEKEREVRRALEDEIWALRVRDKPE